MSLRGLYGGHWRNSEYLGYCYMAFGPLCDPSECPVYILAIRSSVFSVSVGLPQHWPQLDTRGFKKERLLHKTTPTVDLVGTGRIGHVVRCSTVSIVDCGDAEEALFHQPNKKLKGLDSILKRNWNAAPVMHWEAKTSSESSSFLDTERGSDIWSGCLPHVQLGPKDRPLTHWERLYVPSGQGTTTCLPGGRSLQRVVGMKPF